MSTLIITADRGHMRAYRVKTDPLGMESDQMELIGEFDQPDARKKTSELVTDGAGRFGRSDGNKASKGSGERTGIMLELEKRLLRAAAQSINELVHREQCTKWHLAAASSINKKLLSTLSPEVLQRLSINIKSDMIKLDKGTILNRFKEMQ